MCTIRNSGTHDNCNWRAKCCRYVWIRFRSFIRGKGEDIQIGTVCGGDEGCKCAIKHVYASVKYGQHGIVLEKSRAKKHKSRTMIPWSDNDLRIYYFLFYIVLIFWQIYYFIFNNVVEFTARVRVERRSNITKKYL